MHAVMRWSLVLVASCLGTAGSADAGLFWDWGYPGYADGYSSHYAPMSGYAAYGPSYYGPSGGCCGAGSCGMGSCGTGSCGGCGPCQLNYAPGCGCNPCGCDPCGCNSCGVACADGNCAGGNCNLNTAPADNKPIPEPGYERAQPIKPRDPETEPWRTRGPATNDPAGTEPDGGDAPGFEPPTNRTRNPGAVDPMDDPLNSPMDTTIPPPRTRTTPTDGRPAPFGSGRSGGTSGSGGAGEAPAGRPPRTPLPTDDPIDPAATGGSFEAGKVELPAEEVLPVPPPEEPEAGKPAKSKSDAGTPEAEHEPMTRAPRDAVVTTRPVVEKTRLVMHGGASTTTVVKRPAKGTRESSVTPTDRRIVRH